jgi:tRNA A58 N-methylase Trm61
MATKSDTTWVDDQKVEDVAEKTSHSSAELDAHHVVLDEAESARVLRKVDMRLVPMLSLLYLVAFIDRSNSTSITTRHY